MADPSRFFRLTVRREEHFAFSTYDAFFLPALFFTLATSASSFGTTGGRGLKEDASAGMSLAKWEHEIFLTPPSLK